MRKVPFFLLVCAMFLLVVAQGARADVIFDTLGQPPLFSEDVGGSLAAYTQTFIVGPQDYSLTNVIVGLNEVAPGLAGDSLSVDLWDSSGAGGTPGVLIAHLTGDTNPTIGGDYTYTPSGTVALGANVMYDVVLSVDAGGGVYNWDYSDAPGPDVGNGYYAPYNGTTWNGLSGPAAPQIMRVNADPVGTVPEPGTLALLLMGLPMGLIWRKRRA